MYKRHRKWSLTQEGYLNKPVIIKDTMIEQVTSYRYLGFYMDSVFCWKTHIDSLCTRLQQGLYFLRRLRLYGVGSNILLAFYRAMLESLIRYGITVWFGNLSVQLKNILANIHKTAMKIIGIKQYKPIQTLYEQAVLRRAISISTDPDHSLFSEYQPLPSGKRLRMPMCKTNRLKLSFVPASIKMLNSNKNNSPIAH